MATTKKFKTEQEYNEAVLKIEYYSNMYYSKIQEIFLNDYNNVKKKTMYLEQAHQLMALVTEKISQHNAECKRQATVMKGKAYQRNNITGYQF